MKMNMRKPVIAATLAATMLLAGCGKGTNIPNKYKDFFDYTFGGDYTVEETVSEKDLRRWDISYKCADGNSYTSEYQWNELRDSDKEFYPNEKRRNDEEVFIFSVYAMSKGVETEFYERFIADNFDFDTPDPDDFYTYNENGGTLAIGVISPLSAIYDEEYKLIEQQLSTESGIKVSDYDLKKAAQNPTLYTQLSITVDSSADSEECIAKMEKIYQDFIAYTESPQNFSFILRRFSATEENAKDTLYRKDVIMGEEIDNEAMKAADKNFSLEREMRYRLTGNKY